MMQVKRAIEKAIIHKLPIYNDLQVLVLSLHIIFHDLLFVFQLWLKLYYTALITIYNVLPTL